MIGIPPKADKLGTPLGLSTIGFLNGKKTGADQRFSYCRTASSIIIRHPALRLTFIFKSVKVTAYLHFPVNII